jgi:hypothetical protein
MNIFILFCQFLVKDNWLQIDIAHPTRVTALVTKGRGDRGEQWVTKYILAFSNEKTKRFKFVIIYLIGI